MKVEVGEEGERALNGGGGEVGGKRARTDAVGAGSSDVVGAKVVKGEDGGLNKASLEHLMSA